MQKLTMISTALLMALAANMVLAADATGNKIKDAAPGDSPMQQRHEEMMGGGKMGHDWTLEEARKHAHERAEKLDKMTPQEWAEHQKRRHEWRDHWKSMTVEQKKEWREKRKERMNEKKNDAAGKKPDVGSVPASGSGN